MRHHYRIGIFDDPTKARQAVDDVIAAGVSRRRIKLVMPDNEPDEWSQRVPRDLTTHPADDTERSQVGGGFGGSVGGLLGSLSLYLADGSEYALYAGLATSVLAGTLAGAYFARIAPQLLKNVKDSSFSRMSRRDVKSDARRSAIGGMLGGAFGSLAGTSSSYLIGIPSLWYFVSSGLWAAGASIVVGSLVGAMSGRGQAPRGLERLEDLSEGDNKILVSIDVVRSEKVPEIEELLRRDGAMQVRPA